MHFTLKTTVNGHYKKVMSSTPEFYYNLKPATFMNYEIGSLVSLIKNKLTMDFALYQMNGQNELLNIRQADGSTDFQSAGQTLHRGLEFGVNYNPSKQFAFRFNGTNALHKFINFELSKKATDLVKNLDGKTMPNSPKWMWNTELSYYPSWLKGLRTAIEWQHMDGYFENQVNTKKVASYDLINFRIGYKWKCVEVFTNVLNVTDLLYSTNVTSGNNSTDRATYTPAAPRTFVFGIQYNFVGKKAN